MCLDNDELSWKLFEHNLQTCGFSPGTFSQIEKSQLIGLTIRPYLNVFVDATVDLFAERTLLNIYRIRSSFQLCVQIDASVVLTNQ